MIKLSSFTAQYVSSTRALAEAIIGAVSRSVPAFLLSFVLLASLTACDQGQQDPQSSRKAIAISFPNLNQSAIAQAVVSWAKKEASTKNFDILLDDPGADINAQVNTIQVWIQQKVAVIMAIAPDPNIFSTMAKRATDNGVKWITYAGTVKNQSAELNFSSAVGGELLGKTAAEWINGSLGGSAKVAILTYSPGRWAVDRQKAIEAEIAKLAPNAKIVAIQDAVSTIDGYNQTRTILSANPDLNVVLAATETASEGAYRAMIDSGHTIDDPKVFVGGIDGSRGGLELVSKSNTIYRASIALSHRDIGVGIVTLAERLLKGETGDVQIPWTIVRGGDPIASKFLVDAKGAQ